MKFLNAIHFFLVFFALHLFPLGASSSSFIARELQEEHPDRKVLEKKQFLKDRLPDHIEQDDEESFQKDAPINASQAKCYYKKYYPKVKRHPYDKKTLSILLQVAKVWHTEKRYWPKVLKIYKAYLIAYPKNTDIFFKEAQVELWMNKKKKAQKTLLKLMTMSPENTDGASLLVKAYIRRKKWKKAQCLLDRFPNLTQSEQDRAIVAMGLKRYQCAQKYYEKLVCENPNNIVANRGLAGALSTQRKFKAAKPYYKKITKLEPKNQRYWTEYAYIKSFTNPSLLLEGSYTQSRENDPTVMAPVVEDYYTLGGTTIFVPIFDRWRLSAKQIYFHQKEEDVYPPMGLNYNVYVYGAQIASEVLIWKKFKWDLNLRYLGARGYNNNALFPFNSKSLFEPGTSFIYSSPWLFAVVNSHVESFIIKNFKEGISQLLRTIYVHGGYVLKPDMALQPTVEVSFDEVFYHDSIHNRRNTLYVIGQINLIKSYLKFLYEFRQANFRDLTENYYSFRRQLRNTIGGIIEFSIQDRFSFKCVYEHWWKYTAGLVQPIGSFVFVDNRQRLQGDKVTLFLGYQIRDKLKIEAIGHLQYTTLPYRDYNVGGRIFWQF